MTKGYLVMAQGPQYARQAEALARSITDSQSKVTGLSVITDQPVDHSLFDQVINLTVDLAPQSEWRIENRVQFYDLTPYDQTVILDSDMLFLSDVSHWWDYLEKYQLFLTNKVQTYRGAWVNNNNSYRRAFTANRLPHVYSAFTYFTKSPLASDFFMLVKSIVLNWDQWATRFTPVTPQKFPSIDLAMSMAVSIMNIESEVTGRESFPTFTHMKGKIQGWRHGTDTWSDAINTYKTDQGIKLGAFDQTGILHYVQKDFV